MLKIGIIGYGYWGPNLVRNFNSLDAAKILAVCDKAPESLEKVRRIYPGVGTCTDYRDITSSPEIDAVVIVTPVFSHYELARRALENGKHVFVEKPFTSTSAQA
ncbi:MAG: Gfo/Idh/MocA family oxidoreductase, partial [Nitrospiraceae bacterium]|nr:Gfo/Idh/MocA family oxidoreductase [Nitrospiraceae bacterium]